MKALTEVLLTGNKVYHIPEFQREFVWGREEVEELFNDFSEDTEAFTKSNEDLQGYLLGNIVLIENGNNRYLVIDGQQRLTTITLLFKALYQRINSIINTSEGQDRDRWLRKIGQLNAGYQINDDEDNFKGLRITHDEGLTFGEYYRALIRDNVTDESEKNTSSDQNIAEVFDTLTDKLSELNQTQLGKFIAYIKTKVKLIVTIAPSEGKAFQLFEVLNDRGRSLEPMDLVKNTFLKQLRLDGFSEEDTKEFNRNWSDFISNLTISSKKKISSSNFMKHFITGTYGENVRQDKLFDFFKKDNKLSGTEILQLAQKLKKYSKIYTSIEKNAMDNQFLQDNSNMFILFKLLRIKQLHPLLMRFYDSDESTKEFVTDICVKYGAVVVFSLTQTNTIEKELPTIISKIDGRDAPKEKDILTEIVRKQISNYSEILFNVISVNNFANSNGKPLNKSIDILKFIELYYNKNNLVLNPSKKITREHILANKTNIQDYAQYGFIDAEDFSRYINRMGNLTLLYPDENTAAGINPVNVKKNIYENSDFVISRTMVRPEITAIRNGAETQRLVELNQLEPQYDMTSFWTKKQIEERGKNLANLLLKMVNI